MDKNGTTANPTYHLRNRQDFKNDILNQLNEYLVNHLTTRGPYQGPPMGSAAAGTLNLPQNQAPASTPATNPLVAQISQNWQNPAFQKWLQHSLGGMHQRPIVNRPQFDSTRRQQGLQ